MESRAPQPLGLAPVPVAELPVRAAGRDVSDRAHLAIALALLLVAGLMRFAMLGSKGLWFDEIHTLTQSAYPNAWGTPHDLFFRISNFFLTISSNPTLAVRIYPAIVGTLTVPLMYLFVSRLYSRTAGFIAAVLTCFQPFHLSASQEGRFYAPMIFFSVLAFWSFLNFASEPRRRRFLWLPVFGLALFFSVHNHPASPPFVLAMALGALATLLLTDWGRDAVAQGLPFLKGRLIMRPLLAGLIVVAFIVMLMIFGSLRRELTKALFLSTWGATPEVEFSPRFFVDHLVFYGWDIRRFPVLGALAASLNPLLVIIGAVALWKKSRPFLGMFLFLLFSTFLAVFAYSTGHVYLMKYTAFLQPVILALIGIGLAFALQQINSFAKLAPRRMALATAAIALFILISQSPALAYYYAHARMPLRTQFEWINTHVKEPANVYVYGHVGFPASLYRQDLSPQHALQYFPWVPDSGRLEAEVLEGAAITGRPTYFAFAWQWDVPPYLRQWLTEKGREVVRFVSIEGKDQDGILYEILPPKEDKHKSASRVAAAIDGFGSVGRPEIVNTELGESTGLKFTSQASVTYNIPVAKNQPHVIDVETTAASDGPFFLTVSAAGMDPVILGGLMAAGETVKLSGKLLTPKDAPSIQLRYASDYALGKPSRHLVVEKISVRTEQATGVLSGTIPMPPLHTIEINKGKVTGLLQGWSWRPENAFEAIPDMSDGLAKFKIFGPTAEDKLICRIASPVTTINHNDLIHIRTQVRLFEAFGYAASLSVQFFDQTRKTIAQVNTSTDSLSCRVDWDPWLSQLTLNPLREFESVLFAPKNSAFMAGIILVWKSQGQRRIAAGANQIHIRPFEISVLKFEPPRPGAPAPAGPGS